MHVKILCLLAFLAMVAMARADKKVLCYYESWGKYRKGAGKYTINDLPANLCTHVFYAFVGINNDGSIKLLDDASDLTNFVNHIKKFSGVKPLVSIGGGSEGSKKFSEVVSNPSTRQRFVKNAVSFLEKYKFEGLDVDWEYPSQNGGRGTDKKNYVLLLKELKEAFGNKHYILSAAVSAVASSASKSYEISQISKYLDYINVMTYDFNGNWNPYTGMNSPLYASSKDSSFQKTLNVNAAIRFWISQGAPRSKLIVGLPFYGRTFNLKSASSNGLYAPSSGPGKAQPYTGEAGFIGYNEMCVELKKGGGWHVQRNNQQRVPYAYKDKLWVTYDDPTSIKEKVEFVKSMNLGGAMIWSVGTDDFRGDCGQKNMLLNTVHKVLRG